MGRAGNRNRNTTSAVNFSAGTNYELWGNEMGRTTWACPGCGQQQSREHANSEKVEIELCAACAEAAQKDRDAKAEHQQRADETAEEHQAHSTGSPLKASKKS